MNNISITKTLDSGGGGGGIKPPTAQPDMRGYLNLTSPGDIGVTKKVTDAKKIESVNPVSQSRSFSIDQYTWAEEYTPNGVIRPDNDMTQKMILTEFQPDFAFQWGKTNDLIMTVLEKGLNMVNMSGIAKAAAGVALHTGAPGANNATQNKYISSANDVVGLPIDFIKGLFKGTYINTFEVPFFGSTYLKADTTGNWSAGGSKQVIGEKAAEIMKTSMSMDFPATPTWQISDTATRDTFTCEFHIINTSSDALLKNFKFLNSIIAGAYWVQMDYVQKSPNVYDILVPGRFHIYFAAISIEINCVGKLRKNPGISNQLSNVKGIDANTLFPDAYKITINVKDLCPNNFNNYVDYVMQGAGGQVQVGGKTDLYWNESNAASITGQFMDGMYAGLGKVSEMGAGMVSKILNATSGGK